MSLLGRAFRLEFSERSYAVGRIEGRIPSFVRGEYFSNGPARYAIGDLRYRHLLDGDGMVRSLFFEDGRVTFGNRFIRSTKFCEEETAGRALFRTFGTRFSGDRLNPSGVGIESPVNVSIFRYAGRLLAFGEQGVPWEIDPRTLETLGPYTFGGCLNEVSPFSAHPKVEDGELYNFGISFSVQRPSLNLYRFDARGRSVYRRRLDIPRPSSVHDFCLSPRYALVYMNPHILDIEALRSGRHTILESLRWEPEHGSTLLVASRETGARVASVPLSLGYCLHTVNAYEEDDRLVFDIVEMDEPVYPDYEVIPDIFLEVRPGRAVRYVIDTKTWKVVSRVATPSSMSHDFPVIDPRRVRRKNDRVFMLSLARTGEPGRKYFDQLTAVDTASGRVIEAYRLPDERYFGSEATFIPDPARDGAGVLLCKRFDAEREQDVYLLFDADSLAAGPIACLPLEGATPPCFHGSYYPDPHA